MKSIKFYVWYISGVYNRIFVIVFGSVWYIVGV